METLSQYSFLILFASNRVPDELENIPDSTISRTWPKLPDASPLYVPSTITVSVIVSPPSDCKWKIGIVPFTSMYGYSSEATKSKSPDPYSLVNWSVLTPSSHFSRKISSSRSNENPSPAADKRTEAFASS